MSTKSKHNNQFKGTLIDRLIDHDNLENPFIRETASKENVLESIRVNIEWFLYTTNSFLPDSYDPNNITVLDYGICDFFSMNLFDPQEKKLFSTMLCDKITVFEPRLKNIHVDVFLQDRIKKQFRITITGIFILETIRENVKFMTIIPDDDRKVEVMRNE